MPHLKKSHGQLAVMSSYSGEIGLIYRTGYCSSKFAVTGFFEALRMETKDQFDITIVCPPTVETNLRKNAIVMKHTENEVQVESQSTDENANNNNNTNSNNNGIQGIHPVDGQAPPKNAKYSMTVE